jgi:carboxyl-terminal processing protease
VESLAILDALAFTDESLPEDFFEVVRLCVSNAELAALTESPDLIERIVVHRRLNGLEQDVRRPSTPDGVAFHIYLTLFADARLAEAEMTLPATPVGFAAIGAFTGASVLPLQPRLLTRRRALAICYGGESPTGDPLAGLAVRFRAGRLIAIVSGIGPQGSLPEDDVWTLVAALEARIDAAPPPPAHASEIAAVATQATGAMILENAFMLLHDFHHRSPSTTDLLTAAYEGAAAFVVETKGRDLPASPVVSSSDPAIAWAQFLPVYQELERRVGIEHERALAYAAAQRMYDRHDCHTTFLAPPLFRRFVTASRGDGHVGLGVTASARAPYVIMRVLPASPAETAGLRAGDEIVAVDGLRPSDGGGGVQALLTHERAGRALSITVIRPSMTEPLTVMAVPGLLKPPVARHLVLPSGLGYCEFNSFTRGEEAAERVGDALSEFAAADVKGWILDLRYNGGGWARTMCRVAGLFLPEGSLLTTQHLPDATERRQFSLGSPLPGQRPLVVLIGPTTVSAAEIVAESLRAYGRATLVGSRTAGCVNGGRDFALLDGSGVRLAEFEFLVGPLKVRLESSGVEPDILVDMSRHDLAASRDPQLAAAERVLLGS